MRTYSIGSSAWQAKAGNGNKGELSPRQSQVLSGIAHGLSYGQIANLLRSSRGTVANTANTVLFKLRANSRDEAVAKAITKGWLNKAMALALCVGMVQLNDDAARIRVRNRSRRDEIQLVGEL